jgi:tRNA1(Val) A37 N6-methylase TrmN6
MTDEFFWERVEGEIYKALNRYAERAENGNSYQRRLFTNDAVRGFAFIDLCRKKFDVALMNPPFGAGSNQTKAALEIAYPRTKNDVYAAFVERGLQLLGQRGQLGAITSRTGFFLSSFQKWREEILLKEAQPTVFADLGYGVLDAAMVETAAYCLSKEVA